MFYINGRFLTQPVTGVNRFALEVCKSLKKLQIEFRIIVPKWFNYNGEFDFDITKYGNLKSHFWEQFDLLRFLNLNNRPLLINFSGLGPLWYKNQIITIHDLSFYFNPNWFSFSYRCLYTIATPILARTSRAIFTVSFFSKSEIVKYLSIPEEKIFVIYNAVGDLQSEKRFVKVDDHSKRGFILAVSSLDPRKNYDRLIEAFSSPEFLNYDLILVGKSATHFKFEVNQLFQKNIKFVGYVSDSELSELYQTAALFVYPSLYEGFGIPPLEAMSKSCPIVVSDIVVLREVCGNAAFYVDPYEPKSIRDGMLNVLNDNELRLTLISEGINRVRGFSWASSAEKVEAIIRKIENESSSNN